MADKPTYETLEKKVRALENVLKDREILQTKLANAIEIARLGPWEYDVATDRFTFDDHFYKMLRTTAEQEDGYSMSSAEYVRRFVHPEDIPYIEKETQKALVRKAPDLSRQIEHRIIRADGTIAYIVVRDFMIQDSQGRAVKIYGVNQDITERKRIETQLQRRIEFEQIISKTSFEFARSVSEGIDAAIENALGKVGKFTGADRAYVFQFRNGTAQMDNTHEWCAEGIEPQIANLKGITVGAELPWFAGRIRKCETVHIPDVAALPTEAWRERKHFEDQGIQSLIVVPIETANRLNGFLGFDAVRNRRTWGEDDRNILRFLGETIGHVMERKRAEEALRESEARWQFALEGAGDGVWDMNVATDKVYYSSRWKSMLGYGEEEIGDTMDVWEALLHPDDREAVYAKIERNLHGETAIFQSEHRLRCKDGSYKWILARGKEIEWTEDGKPLRVIGTHSDISEAKELQKKHEQLIGELQEALAKVKQLSGMLPICSYCKKIRDDKGYWKQIETYIRDHSEAEFSHSICRECAEKYHPEYFKPGD